MTDAPKQAVILVNSDGVPVFVFETDREELPPVATWLRDRIFHLDFQGDLGVLAGFPFALHGAVYVEAQPWRISMATIDKPRATKRRRWSAVILPFKKGGAS